MGLSRGRGHWRVTSAFQYWIHFSKGLDWSDAGLQKKCTWFGMMTKRPTSQSFALCQVDVIRSNAGLDARMGLRRAVQTVTKTIGDRSRE